MPDEIHELRLRYSDEAMAGLIESLDSMGLGDLPEELAMFLAHASNATNWHDVTTDVPMTGDPLDPLGLFEAAGPTLDEEED